MVGSPAGRRTELDDRLNETKEPALNADPAAQLTLLEVQSLDSRLDQLAHKRRTLPELARIAELDSALAALGDRIVGAETEQSDTERARVKADDDVEQVRARARRNQERLDSGAVTSAKDLENLQHELGSLARRQSELEDVELEVMERLEDIAGRLSALSAERDRLQAERSEQVARRDEQFAEIDGDASLAKAERDRQAGYLPDDLSALYEKLRASNAGVGAAALRQRRCEGCRLELTTTDLNRIRAAEPDEVLRCEECRRILVRTEESGL